jgi:hypothetical protein
MPTGALKIENLRLRISPSLPISAGVEDRGIRLEGKIKRESCSLNEALGGSEEGWKSPHHRILSTQVEKP